MRQFLSCILRLEPLESRHVPNQLVLSLALELESLGDLVRPVRSVSPAAGPGLVRPPTSDSLNLTPASPRLSVLSDTPAVQPTDARNPSVSFHRPNFDYDGRSLTYLEYSNGLQVPTMEKGNTEIEFGDVNHDGYADLVSIGDHGAPNINATENGIMVWFGNRLGNWSLVESGNFGYGGVALGDVNGDTVMDIGYSMHHDYSSTDFGDQLIEVALGNGTGQNWTPWDDGLATSGEDYGMFETDFADIDNDGDLDVGSVSFGCCSGVHIYRNNGNGTWTQSFGFLGGNTRNNFFFGDVNGDGNADFASGHAAGTVYLGDGQGTFQLGDGNLPAPGGIGRLGLSLGDVNRDGRDDLAYVAGGGLHVWSWVSNGVWQNISSGLPTSGQNEVTQIADMDRDGNGDLIAFAKGLITVYAGDGAGNWTVMSSFSTPGIYGYAAFRVGTDVDHNGFPDIGVVAAEGSSSFNARNRPRVFVESSVPTELSIYPDSPRGGEKLIVGSVRFIDWHAAVPQFVRRTTVSIDLSTTGPAGPWLPVATNLKNNGRYQWQIPLQTPTTSLGFLRFTMHTAFGNAVAVSPRPFTIAPPS